METLKGVRIFGYGTIIPMALIKETEQLPKQQDSVNGSFQSTACTRTPIEMEIDQKVPMNTDSWKNFTHNNENTTWSGVGSPTRINSSNNIQTLDQICKKRENSDNNTNNQGINNDLKNGGVLFNEKLIGQIIEKAEFGRVVMGIDDI
ncbi:unnamed protein product [Wickerhamomyces anomalus]